MYATSFGGSEILIIDPEYVPISLNTNGLNMRAFYSLFVFRTGEIVDRIPFPCKLISGVTFAEKKWNVLYVLTSSFSGFGPQSNEAGKLFKVSDLGAKGCKPHKVNL